MVQRVLRWPSIAPRLYRLCSSEVPERCTGLQRNLQAQTLLKERGSQLVHSWKNHINCGSCLASLHLVHWAENTEPLPLLYRALVYAAGWYKLEQAVTTFAGTQGDAGLPCKPGHHKLNLFVPSAFRFSTAESIGCAIHFQNLLEGASPHPKHDAQLAVFADIAVWG